MNKALSVSRNAISNGSLTPLQTNLERVQDKYNSSYELRSLKNNLYTFNKSFIGPNLNPFKPWDKFLEISSVLNKHHLILNKYPVQIGHMLLITNSWSPQLGWLETDDFKALISVNQDTTGLWFFNSCKKAGASQPHRHIQLLPRQHQQEICPRENWFINNINKNINLNSKLSRSIAILPIKEEINDKTGLSLYKMYLNLCNKLSVGDISFNTSPTIPYNLIITNQWIAIIKRSRDSYRGFSINALGFAGYLLSTNDSELDWLKTNGIENLLCNVV